MNLKLWEWLRAKNEDVVRILKELDGLIVVNKVGTLRQKLFQFISIRIRKNIQI